MRDFIGQEIKVGSYLAAGGAGNTATEYGMILYCVEKVEPSLRLTRLKVSYPDNEAATVQVRTATIQKTNRYVVVKPNAKVKGLFKRAIDGKLRSGEAQTIASWVQGSIEVEGVFS